MKKQEETQNTTISLTEFRDFMFKQIVPLDDIMDHTGQPMENLFPFWRRKGLLPFIVKGAHCGLEISFTHLIWLRILDTCRVLGYPISNTKKVADYFFKDAYLNDLPKKNIAYNRSLLLPKKEQGTITDEELITLAQIESNLNNERLLNFLKFDVNYLSNLIQSCLLSSEEAGILLYGDGRVLEYVGNDQFSHQLIDFDTNAPHVAISIKHLLKEFIDSKELENIIMPNILNMDEKYILTTLRNKNIQELTIKKNGKDIVKIDASSDGIISGEKAKEIKRILGLKNYEEIQISTRDEKTLQFKKKSKKLKP